MSDYRQALSSLRKETVQNDDDELMCDIVETGIDMLETQNAELLEALEKVVACSMAAMMYEIGDQITEAIRKAKGK